MFACKLYIDRLSLQSDKDTLVKLLDDARSATKAAQAEATKTPPGRYQFSTRGLAEWRFDTATGDTCILLAADPVWKDARTKMQSCTCEDSQKSYDAATNDAVRKNIHDGMKANGCFEYTDKLLGLEKSSSRPIPK